MAIIRVKDLYDHNLKYRVLFVKILRILCYDLRLSLLVMAFLLWLQEHNDRVLVLKLLAKPFEEATATIMETQYCIDCLVSESNADYDAWYAIFSTFSKLNISLQSLYLTKYTTISAMKRYLRTHCCRLFSDIISDVLYGSNEPLPYQPLNIQGFPDPVFGNVNFIFWPRNHIFDTQDMIWSWHAVYVDEDDRSLYLTFSHGYPVSESEVREVFGSRFGDGIELIDIAHTRNNQRQALFARVVMRYVETIDQILRGGTTVKFKIKGKHVWAKKYKCRRNDN